MKTIVALHLEYGIWPRDFDALVLRLTEKFSNSKRRQESRNEGETLPWRNCRYSLLLWRREWWEECKAWEWRRRKAPTQFSPTSGLNCTKTRWHWLPGGSPDSVKCGMEKRNDSIRNWHWLIWALTTDTVKHGMVTEYVYRILPNKGPGRLWNWKLTLTILPPNKRPSPSAFFSVRTKFRQKR